MRNILRLALANIRKGKSRSASFLLIAAISALLFNLGLITWGDYASSFDEKARRLDAPDVVLIAQQSDPAFTSSFLEELREDTRVEAAQSHPALLTGSEFIYANGVNSRQSAFFDRSKELTMGKFALVEELSEMPEHPIYLSYLFQTGGGYRAGDSFTITLFTPMAGEQTFTYTVAGFFEDIYFSTINSTTSGFLLGHEEYITLENAFHGDASGVLLNVKTVSPEDNESVVAQYRAELSEQLPGRMVDSNHYAALKSARTITSSIGASIILGFATLLLLVSLVVVNFRIRNSVEEEIKNIGALKALGYTSRQLISAFLLQFLLLALLGSLLGILCSLAVLPGLAGMFASQTGIVWEQHFSPFAAATTLAAVELLVGVVAFASAARIRKLPPIVALRTGVLTHSFRRNPFPLSKGRGPLTLTLACKQLVHSIRQNLLVCLIVAGVSFAAVFAGVLYYNINIESDVFLRMVSGQIPSAQLEAVNPDAAQRLMEEVQSTDSVKTAYFFGTESVNCDGQREAYAYLSDDLDKTSNANWLYEGRFPRYENEVAVGGLLAKSLDKEIGDVIRIAQGDVEAEYLITGFIQGSNYMGHDLCMTEAAYHRIAPSYAPLVISVELNDREDATSFLDQLKANTADLNNGTNVEEIIRSSMSSYQNIVAMLAVIISAVTLVIIGLVLYLVIQTLLIRKKRDLGIQKAVGFTTAQLVFQNALTFLPVIVLGALLGCSIGYLALNPFFSMLFSGIGIMKVSFVLSMPLFASVFGMIVLFGFGISALVSCKIKRISPYELMSE